MPKLTVEQLNKLQELVRHSVTKIHNIDERRELLVIEDVLTAMISESEEAESKRTGRP